MEQLLNRLKDKLEKMNNKELVHNLFIFLIILIIFLIGINLLFGNKNKDKVKEEYPIDQYSNYDYNSDLENRLIRVLQKLKGVGQVDVMITLEDSIEKIPASNTTRTTESTLENDSEGGVREIKREDTNTQIVNSQSSSLITIKEVNPIIKGVIVVAKGADDPLVLETLYQAVKTVLGVNGNRVEIYSSY